MSRIQARVTLPEELQREIAPLRERWNPERALGNPAHVTIAYHDEAPDAEMLEARLRAALRNVAPFGLFVGKPAQFRAPARGVFLQVSDPTNAIASIRDDVLVPPFAPRAHFDLPVTVLHSEQGDRLAEAWRDLSRSPSFGSFDVSALQLVGSNNETMVNVHVGSSSRS